MAKKKSSSPAGRRTSAPRAAIRRRLVKSKKSSGNKRGSGDSKVRAAARRAPGLAAKARRLAPEIKKLRDRLLRLRAELTGRIGAIIQDHLSLAADDTQMDFRSEEQGTDNFERDMALIKAGTEQEVVFEIDEALARINAGKFGRCEMCGKPVEKARLQAIPYSRRCFKCQTEAERMQRASKFVPTGPIFSGPDRQDQLSEEEEE